MFFYNVHEWDGRIVSGNRKKEGVCYNTLIKAAWKCVKRMRCRLIYQFRHLNREWLWDCLSQVTKTQLLNKSDIAVPLSMLTDAPPSPAYKQRHLHIRLNLSLKARAYPFSLAAGNKTKINILFFFQWGNKMLSLKPYKLYNMGQVNIYTFTQDIWISLYTKGSW